MVQNNCDKAGVMPHRQVEVSYGLRSEVNGSDLLIYRNKQLTQCRCYRT